MSKNRAKAFTRTKSQMNVRDQRRKNARDRDGNTARGIGGGVKKPCIVCGDPDCVTHVYGAGPRKGIRRPEDRNARGYDAAWARLSRAARRAQPFCSDCGVRADQLGPDEYLTTDHTPEAWRRRERGQRIRLRDVDVVCMDCNIKRGAARGAKVTRKDETPVCRSEGVLLQDNSRLNPGVGAHDSSHARLEGVRSALETPDAPSQGESPTSPPQTRSESPTDVHAPLSHAHTRHTGARDTRNGGVGTW